MGSRGARSTPIKPPPIELPPPLPEGQEKREQKGHAGNDGLPLGLAIGSAFLLLLVAIAIFATWTKSESRSDGKGDATTSGGGGETLTAGTLAAENAQQAAAGTNPDDASSGSDEQSTSDSQESGAATVAESSANAASAAESNPGTVSGDEVATGTDKDGMRETDIPVIGVVPKRVRPSLPAAGADAEEGDLSASDDSNPFIGQGRPAKSTVFVIDKSGSMANSMKLGRVINALRRAIEQLKPGQSFAVLFFDDQYYSHPSVVKPESATEANKKKVLEWLTSVYGGGGTDPSDAMFQAIQWNPERIVLLTDGEFDPTYAALITTRNQANRRPCRIDCVGLFENVQVLREIADGNNGIYYQAK